MMTLLGRALRKLLRTFRDFRGVSLYETTAAVAMAAIVAAVAVPVALDRIEDAKKAKGSLEVEAISKAMLRFFQDTGKWPGELEIIKDGKGVFLKTGTAAFPSGVSDLAAQVKIPTDGSVVDCPSSFDGTATPLNLNNFLVNKPSGYQNWRGPYMDPVEGDAFDKAYFIHIVPLFCGEKIETGTTTGAGNLGYGWVLSGGPDQKIQQDLKKPKLDATSDDAGRNNGKRTIVSAG